ncbi:YlqD family protein [Bacillus sp. 31A1R]|uniref:YlqD family protein n=1 Tax=Robertmurraya mangrovi TaxID=3098077 RepID=A0ABU5J4L5_9BACI|nr:YlqD family protein [Bacillus sp. 31A1R]MDZ5474365.1 YlqD family protein [Bacillus sp. 31A1R]
MNILQNIIVKQKLTENSKAELEAKYNNKKLQLQKECDQLLFELKKLEKTKKFQPSSLKTHFDKEIHNRQEKIKLLEFQLDQLHMLPIGSELKEKEIQGIVEVKVGDRWDDIKTSKTIIIKDGIVDEIR